MENKILVPVNGSKTTERTIAALLAHRERFPLPLTLLHVLDLDRLAYRMIPDFQVAMVREHARRAAESCCCSSSSSGGPAPGSMQRPAWNSVRRGKSSPALPTKKSFELLIIGRRGHGEIRDVLFGSVANHVLHHVTCPVLLF